MKKIIIILAAVFIAVPSFVMFAQIPDDMTVETWQNEMNDLTEQKASLKKELDSLRLEVATLDKTRHDLQSYEDCIESVYTMLGATKKDVDNFRTRLAALMSDISSRKIAKSDRQAELDAMKKNKISALPEFFDKVHNQAQRQLDAWVLPPEKIDYTVVKGDCLWNIAKMKDHYANAFAWPIIYHANRDLINDPDLIYPAQVFDIPILSDEEKAKYEKIKTNYKQAPPAQSQTATIR